MTEGISEIERERIVVVGGGMAAQHFLSKMVESGAQHSFALSLFCEESEPPYDRVHLGRTLESDGPSIELKDSAWYAGNGIALHLKERVLEIDRRARTLRTESGHRVKFDRLVLALGGAPFLPPIAGNHFENVAVYRTTEDVQNIARKAKPGAQVIVAGGGLLGLEAARSIQKRGCSVEIIEMAPRLLPRQLDVEGADVLKKQILNLGLKLRLLTRIIEIRETADGLLAELSGGERIAGDLIVFAAGIRPRDDLAKQAGLACHHAGGIQVDDTLSTPDPAIAAIGECVRHRGELYGFVAPCFEMADVLADRFCGGDRTFTGATSSARLKIEEVDVAAVGDSLAEGPTVRDLTWLARSEYRRIVLRDGRIVGAIAVGAGTDFPRLQEAVATNSPVRVWQERRFSRSGRLWREGTETRISKWPDESILCTCTGTTCGSLRRIREGGCNDASMLSEISGAGTVCGNCRPLLSELVGEDFAATRKSAGVGIGLAALLGLSLLAFAWLVGPVPMSRTVAEGPTIDLLWRDAWWKRVSGFGLLGLCAIALLLSLRKRWPQFAFGTFVGWRAIHTGVGVATIVVAGVHTGLRWGENLNLVLMLSFVGVALLGSVAALVTSLEHRLPPPYGGTLRRSWTLAHILLFWPMPVLAAFHVLAVYYY